MPVTQPGRRPRLLSLVQLLENDIELRRQVQLSLGEMLREVDSLSLFAEAGLPSVHSFTTEIVQRLVAKFMPSARDDSDARKLLTDLYSSEFYAKQFAALTPEVFDRIVNVLTPEDEPAFWDRQEQDLREAMRLLASRVSALGLQPEVRDRSTASRVGHSPFYELVRCTEELIAKCESPECATALDSWKQVVARCRAEMEVVYEHMQSAGISVELVFDLKTIQACLVRMESIARVLTAGDSAERLGAVHHLFNRLIESNLDDKRVTVLLRENLNLLARKIVDRTGETGEHYIANNRAEYRHMWLAAIGGGLLTVFTAAIKMRIVESHAPPFLEGFAAGTNYAVSFIFLQIFGLALATKQPATTAATFARIIRDNRGQQRSSKLTDFVARITTTQLAAAVGNVAAVSLGAAAFEWLWRTFFHESYLPRLSATHVLETLHPYASGTAFFAIITGVILWLAALIGSWMENAAVYYRSVEALAQHPLVARLGAVRARKLTHYVKHNMSGWFTSIALGYLLGFTPEIGQFFGLPLDIRHVTLSTGTLALAAARFGTASGDKCGSITLRRYRRHLCIQPFRQFYDCGLCRASRLRRGCPRAMGDPAVACHRCVSLASALCRPDVWRRTAGAAPCTGTRCLICLKDEKQAQNERSKLCPGVICFLEASRCRNPPIRPELKKIRLAIRMFPLTRTTASRQHARWRTFPSAGCERIRR